MAPPARIHISRQSGGWVDRLRAYQVAVDGERRGRLRAGEHQAFDVSLGSHDVLLKIDWARSPTVRVELAEGEEVHLACQPQPDPFTAVYFALLRRNEYVNLRRREEAAPSRSTRAVLLGVLLVTLPGTVVGLVIALVL